LAYTSDKIVVFRRDKVKLFEVDDDSRPLTKADLRQFAATLKTILEKYADDDKKEGIKNDKKDEVGEGTVLDVIEGRARSRFIERLKHNNLAEMFIGRRIGYEEVDSVVNTLTLMDALILTIPYGLMSSADMSYWDNVEEVLNNCYATVGSKFRMQDDFLLFKNSCNAVIFSSMASLLMAVVYYLLRPKGAAFQVWWKRARYVIIMILIGTISAVVSLVAVSLWLFAWYIIPTSRFCNYSSQQANIVGIVVMSFCFIVSCFLMA
jgi:hypothetical protein